MGENLILKNRYFVTIPKTIDIIYDTENNLLIFVGPLETKKLKLQNKIILCESSNSAGVTEFLVGVTEFSVHNNSNVEEKNARMRQGTILAQIIRIVIEVNYDLYYKLHFVGLGYRACPFDTENLENQLYLKLGYSHKVYFHVPEPLELYCIKFTKVFLFGRVSLESLTQLAAELRACKEPEPYKGKGILYAGEKIVIKKGKKI